MNLCTIVQYFILIDKMFTFFDALKKLSLDYTSEIDNKQLTLHTSWYLKGYKDKINHKINLKDNIFVWQKFVYL